MSSLYTLQNLEEQTLLLKTGFQFFWKNSLAVMWCNCNSSPTHTRKSLNPQKPLIWAWQELQELLHTQKAKLDKHLWMSCFVITLIRYSYLIIPSLGQYYNVLKNCHILANWLNHQCYTLWVLPLLYRSIFWHRFSALKEKQESLSVRRHSNFLLI
jgi:hypothetical protein